MEHKDSFDSIVEPESERQIGEKSTAESIVIDQVVEREPYTGIWTEEEVNE